MSRSRDRLDRLEARVRPPTDDWWPWTCTRKPRFPAGTAHAVLEVGEESGLWHRSRRDGTACQMRFDLSKPGAQRVLDHVCRRHWGFGLAEAKAEFPSAFSASQGNLASVFAALDRLTGKGDGSAWGLR